MMNAYSFDAKPHARAGVFGDFADPVVQLDAGHRAAGRRERRAGPFDLDLAAESAHPQAAMPDPGVQPFAQTQPFEGGHISLRITPNQALVNNFVVQFTGPDGAPVDKAESVSAYLILPAENVGPIVTDLHRVGVGKFVLSNTPDPPIVGTWQITLQIQVSPFDEPDASFVDVVR